MSKFRDWLDSAREKYLFIKKLLRDCNEVGPSNTSTFLKALELFREIENDLKEFQEKDDEIVHHINVLSALLNYEMGLVFISLEKVSLSEDHFLKSLEYVKEHAMKPECFTLFINILVELCILSVKCNDYISSQKAFNRAHDAFDKYKLSKIQSPLVLFEDLFLPIEQRQSESIEVSPNLYLLENSSLAKFIELFSTPKFISHRLIKLKQLLKTDANHKERLLWAAQCNSLFSYFILKTDFSAARYILSCANKIVGDFEKMLEKTNENKNSDIWVFLLYIKTFMYYSWAKYATHLLSYSVINHKKLNTELKAYLTSHLGSFDSDTKYGIIEMQKLFRKDEIKEYEDKVPCTLASNYVEALKIFQFGQNNIMLYENSDTKSSDPEINITLTNKYSELYLFLIHFVGDESVKAKMNKRRIDLLCTALQKIDKQSRPNVYQDIVYELGTAYFALLHIKYEICTSDSAKTTLQNIHKINLLANKIINLYEPYLELYKDENGQFPKYLPENDAERVLAMCDILSHTYEKFICDEKDSLANIVKAKQFCKFIIDYMTKNPKIKDNDQMEITTSLFARLTETENDLHSEISCA